MNRMLKDYIRDFDGNPLKDTYYLSPFGKINPISDKLIRLGKPAKLLMVQDNLPSMVDFVNREYYGKDVLTINNTFDTLVDNMYKLSHEWFLLAYDKYSNSRLMITISNSSYGASNSVENLRDFIINSLNLKD